MKKIPTLLCAVFIALFTVSAQTAFDVPPDGGEVDDVRIENEDNAANGETEKVYVIPIREDIMPSTARMMARFLDLAREAGAGHIVINMNTYGGLLDAADTIRTMIINSDIPVYAFVNNQAISAGALIAIAADSIYMRPGASIGAASVVDQNGNLLPDKYQSFMRSVMRATAESHGKVATVDYRGDTTWRWRRDPQIAQAMVDPSIVVPGLDDSTKVVTLTADEALEWGYSEGMANSVGEVLQAVGVHNYELIEYVPTGLDKLLGFLTNPAMQGLFIMLIIGGLYFELQTPGIGLPLGVAILGAVLYFAPLYVEGLVANWEIILFIAGLVLIILEIFVTPGFGVLGVTGIIAMILGLVFALIDTDLLKYIPTGELPVGIIIEPLLIVVISVSAAFVLSIWLGSKFLRGRTTLGQKVVLVSNMSLEEGFVGRESYRDLAGREGVASTALRPAGKVVVDGVYYEAAGENGRFIEKGTPVTIVRDEGGVVYCVKK